MCSSDLGQTEWLLIILTFTSQIQQSRLILCLAVRGKGCDSAVVRLSKGLLYIPVEKSPRNTNVDFAVAVNGTGDLYFL